MTSIVSESIKSSYVHTLTTCTYTKALSSFIFLFNKHKTGKWHILWKRVAWKEDCGRALYIEFFWAFCPSLSITAIDLLFWRIQWVSVWCFCGRYHTKAIVTFFCTPSDYFHGKDWCVVNQTAGSVNTTWNTNGCTTRIISPHSVWWNNLAVDERKWVGLSNENLHVRCQSAHTPQSEVSSMCIPYLYTIKQNRHHSSVLACTLSRVRTHIGTRLL